MHLTEVKAPEFSRGAGCKQLKSRLKLKIYKGQQVTLVGGEASKEFILTFLFYTHELIAVVFPRDKKAAETEKFSILCGWSGL